MLIVVFNLSSNTCSWNHITIIHGLKDDSNKKRVLKVDTYLDILSTLASESELHEQ